MGRKRAPLAAAAAVAPPPPPPQPPPRQPANAIPLERGWQVLPPGDVLVGYFPDALTREEADEARRVLLPPGSSAVGFCQRSVRVFGRERPQPRLVSYWADHAGLSYTYSGLTLEPRCWHDGGGGGGEAAQEEAGRVLRRLRAAAERCCRRWGDADDAAADAPSSGRALLPAELLLPSLGDDESAALPAPFFNSCLLNLYRGGADSVGWHADNERAFGARPAIASVSLGARRDFFLKMRQPPPSSSSSSSSSSSPRPRYWCSLGGDGDVLVMAGRAQEAYLHCVPARRGGGDADNDNGNGASDPRRVSLTFRRVLPEVSGAAAE